jgi:hypothetical protein
VQNAVISRRSLRKLTIAMPFLTISLFKLINSVNTYLGKGNRSNTGGSTRQTELFCQQIVTKAFRTPIVVLTRTDLSTMLFLSPGSSNLVSTGRPQWQPELIGHHLYYIYLH